MSEETVEVEATEPVEEVPTFSKVFPTCIKYESSNGQIEELWVKEGNIKFLYEADEEGVAKDKKITIQIEVENASKDLVVQRYARGGLFG